MISLLNDVKHKLDSVTVIVKIFQEEKRNDSQKRSPSDCVAGIHKMQASLAVTIWVGV